MKDPFIYDVREASKEAGMPYGRNLKNGFTAHTLRRTFNTEMALAGISQHIIQEVTGYSSDEMFKRYLHVIDEAKKKAIDQYENYVRNQASVNKSVNKTPSDGTDQKKEDQPDNGESSIIIEGYMVPKRGLEPLQELLPTRP